MPDSPLQIRDVVSTVIVDNALAQSIGTVSKLLEKHKGYEQHQLVVMADQISSQGAWSVLFMPDADTIQQNLSVDSTETLGLSSTSSDMVMFTALLRGLVIAESTPGQTGVRLTFVLSSSKGQLVNA